MVTALKFAVVSAIFLLPFAYPHSALSRIWSLSYQEAVWMCSTGDHQACDVMYRYEMARSAVPQAASSIKQRRKHRTDYPAHPTAPTGSLGGSRSSTPILLRLPLYCRGLWVLGLEPIMRAAGPVGRALPLRHDAFETELAGVPEHNVAGLADMLIQLQAGFGTT